MSAQLRPAILSGIASYYSSKLIAHGPTPHGVDWNGTESHELRHRQFLRLLDGAADAAVLDLGCGYGDFFRFLRAHGHRGPFVGYDLASNMVEEARRLHGDGPDLQWRVGATPVEALDFAVASGIFNVKGDVPRETWRQHVEAVIGILARAGREGFAFNMLSMSSDPERRRDDLYYAHPVEMLDHCLAHFGRKVALLQDYGLYEFTVIVRQAKS